MGTLVSCAHVPISAVFRGGTFLLEQPRSGPVLVSPALGSRLTKLAHTDPSLEGNGVPAHSEWTFIQSELFFSERGWLARLLPSSSVLPAPLLPSRCSLEGLRGGVSWPGLCRSLK